MNFYILTHHHHHGTSSAILRSNRVLTEDDARDFLGTDFEDGLDDEWIELDKVEVHDIA